MSTADAVYLRSPVWLQGAFVSTYGWWWRRRRFGPDFHRQVSELRSRESWSGQQFLSLQEQLLTRLLAVARAAPHYARALSEANVTADMPAWDALSRLPFLSKEEVRSHPKELLTTSVPRGTMTFRSSGTTGTPTTIFYTREFHALETAVIEARNLNWASVTYRDRRVMFGARKICRFNQQKPPFWRFSPAENMAYASVYHLAPEFLPAYLAFLRAFRPTVISGYPSALFAVAQYSLEHGDLLPRAQAIVTSAERLSEQMRSAIERAWGAPVYDRYGAVEGCVSACQCEHGRYHVNPEIGIIELVDAAGRPVGPGIEGEIICTGLQNLLQPLIRYRIGDTARWALDQDCACGRHTPILQGIDGRVEDVCVTADGRHIVRFDTVFKGVNGLRQAQVVQETLDRFMVYVVPGEGFSQAETERIQKNMRQHVGDVVTIVQCVPAIERSPSGKFRAVRCLLSQDEKRQVRSPV